MGLAKSLCYQRIEDILIKKICEKSRFLVTTSESLIKKCLQTSNECNSEINIQNAVQYKGRHFYFAESLIPDTQNLKMCVLLSAYYFIANDFYS